MVVGIKFRKFLEISVATL